MTTKTFSPKLMTESATISAIGSIGRRGTALDNDIWSAAYSALHHANGEGQGDLSLFARLLNAMPKGSRVTTLIAWASAHTPIVANKNPQGVYNVKKNRSEDAPDWDLDSLKAIPWMNYKPARPGVTIDLAAIAAYLGKLADGIDTPARTVTAEARAAAGMLREMLSAMGAPQAAPTSSMPEIRKAA